MPTSGVGLAVPGGSARSLSIGAPSSPPGSAGSPPSPAPSSATGSSPFTGFALCSAQAANRPTSARSARCLVMILLCLGVCFAARLRTRQFCVNCQGLDAGPLPQLVAVLRPYRMWRFAAPQRTDMVPLLPNPPEEIRPMPLTPEQQAEIEALRSAPRETFRATAPGLEA